MLPQHSPHLIVDRIESQKLCSHSSDELKSDVFAEKNHIIYSVSCAQTCWKPNNSFLDAWQKL